MADASPVNGSLFLDLLALLWGAPCAVQSTFSGSLITADSHVVFLSCFQFLKCAGCF